MIKFQIIFILIRNSAKFLLNSVCVPITIFNLNKNYYDSIFKI